jgi:NAD(P)H-flavin reductase/hemoglobin-like flavoprotein
VDTARLKASWAAVAPHAQRAAAHFYAALFTLDDSLRGMFPPDMVGQRDKLLAALGHIVSHVDDEATLVPFLRQLGGDHRRFSVRPEHYPLVGKALLYTLSVGLGDQWTPDLADEWAAAFEAVTGAMIDAAAELDAAAVPPWWNAEVVSHELVGAGDVAVITVATHGTYDYQPGQSTAVETHLRPRVWRYFSPANAPRRDGTVDFHVRAVAGGAVSTALAFQARVGDVLRLSAPIGDRLVIPPGPGPDLLLLAGGTGWAPLKAGVERLLADLDDRKITIVVGGAFRHDLYDWETLTSLADRFRQITVVAALTHDPWSPTETVVDAALRDGRSWVDHDIYVCGSPGMVSGTCSALLDEGYPLNRIHVERYNGTAYAPLQAGTTLEGAAEQVSGR